jgi:hypothetical protein
MGTTSLSFTQHTLCLVQIVIALTKHGLLHKRVPYRAHTVFSTNNQFLTTHTQTHTHTHEHTHTHTHTVISTNNHSLTKHKLCLIKIVPYKTYTVFSTNSHFSYKTRFHKFHK